MAAFPDSAVTSTLGAAKSAWMRLPPLTSVTMELRMTLYVGVTVGEWTTAPVLTMGFMREGDSYHGPSVTFWNDGKMEGADNYGSYVTGLPVMDGESPNTYKIVWGPLGFQVYVDDVLYANPPYIDLETFLAETDEPLTTAWAQVSGYSDGGGGESMTFAYIDITGTGGGGDSPAEEFWTSFVASREIV